MKFKLPKMTPLAMTAVFGLVLVFVIMMVQALMNMREGFDPSMDEKIDLGVRDNMEDNPLLRLVSLGYLGHGNAPSKCAAAGGMFKYKWLSPGFCYKKKSESEGKDSSMVSSDSTGGQADGSSADGAGSNGDAGGKSSDGSGASTGMETFASYPY